MIVLLFSCNSNDGDNGSSAEAKISCSLTTIEAPATGDSYRVTVVVSSAGWTASVDDNASSWLKVNVFNSNKTTGYLTVTVDKNKTTAARMGAISVKLGSQQVTINVTQTGKTVVPPIDDDDIETPEGYQLVWHDEFNEGSELNATDWRHEVQKDHWQNEELQNYVNGQVGGKRVTELEDGKLKIHCFKANNGKIYSARVYAHEREGWKYGIFEARIKLPKGKGTWPAFWMMPCNFNNDWPHSGEIDIMEEVGVDANWVVSTIHCTKYNNSGTSIESARKYVDTAESDFHTYRLDWNKDRMVFSVDGTELLTYRNDGTGKATWPFDNNFYIILNLAWGGKWGGYAGVDASALPVTMEVDYVRVFQKK